MYKKLLIVVALFGLFVVGCQQEESIPTATQTAVTNTPVVEDTAVPPTPTDAPTAAPGPTDTAVSEPTAPPFVATFETAACQFDVPNGREVECGYLTVPESHADPGNGRTLRLHVAIFASDNENPAPDPMIYLSGGPGGDALESVPFNFEAVFAPYLVDRDLIMFDQRGTGYSEPSLACPEVLDMTLDSLDDEVSLEEASEMALETFLTCHDRLVNEGVNLAAYNSAENAADVNDLRVALGYDEWNILGASYGSRLAQTVMRDHPEGIRSVILDSTYPLAANIQVEMPHNMRRAMDVFFDACTADAVCNEAYPDLETVFYALVDQFNEDPITFSVPYVFTGEQYDVRFDGYALLGQLFQALYVPDLTSLFPQVVYNTRAGDYELLSGYMTNSLAKIEFVSHGMQFSVQCHEEIAFSNPEDVVAAAAAYPELEAIFMNSFIGNLGFPLCEAWGAGQAAPIENESIVSDIPTLILAGEHDPVTPPAWGKQVGEGLSRHFFFEFPGMGHGPGLTHECPRGMALAFLNDPLTQPDDSCMADMHMSFVTPVDSEVIALVPVTIEEFGLSALVPEGWIEVRPEYRVAPDRSVELVIQEKVDEALDSVLERWHGSDVLAEIEANDLTWAVREILHEESGRKGYIATTPSEAGFYLVLVLSTPEQQETMYTAVFQPVVESVVVGVTETGETDINDDGDTAAVVLVPFTSEPFHISGMVPEGWTEAAPGVMMRGQTATDLTTLIQKSYPDVTLDELIATLLPLLGLDALPEPVDSYETAAFIWDLYTIEVDAPGVGLVIVDMALVEHNDVPHLVLLQVLADEHAPLFEQVFMPAVDALTPEN